MATKSFWTFKRLFIGECVTIAIVIPCLIFNSRHHRWFFVALNVVTLAILLYLAIANRQFVRRYPEVR